VADSPDGIAVGRDRDMRGRANQIWIRRGLLALVAAIPILALFNVFGQRPDTSFADSPAASLKVYAPSRVRGGLLYTARFHITAHRQLGNLRLVLSSGWLEQMTLNAIGPQPVQQASENGKLDLILGHLRAGKTILLWISYQVNPTNVGRRPQDVALDDGNQRLVTIHRTFTVFP
jgi:hypothetical protein